MRAHRIIEGATFGPDVIRTAGAAFEAAWSEVADRFEVSSHEDARDLLASSIISAVRQECDAEALRRAGLQAIARAYPSLFATNPAVQTERKGN
jgi:hypothetical protein